MRKKHARRPMLGARLKLEVRDKDPNFHYRWFNDEGSRIQDALDAGYEHVQKHDVTLDTSAEKPGLGSNITKGVGKHPNGSPKMAYLMRTQKEYFEEDQIEKQKAADLVDQAIRSGSLAQVPNAYTPGHDTVVGDVARIRR